MLPHFVLLIVCLFCAKSTLATPAVPESGQASFYLVQFDRIITTDIVKKLSILLGYVPTDYVPDNTLLIWFSTTGTGLPDVYTLPSLIPHISFITPFEQQYRKADIRATLNSAAFQKPKMAHLNFGANETIKYHNAEQFASTLRDAYKKDQSGSLVVRLIVKAHKSASASILKDMSASHSRTSTVVSKALTHDESVPFVHYIVDNVHCDDADRVAEAILVEDRVMWVEMRPVYQTHNRWAIPGMLYQNGGDQRTISRRNLGLYGVNQILSVSDTGVEYGTCMFSDSQKRKPPMTPIQEMVPEDNGHDRIRAIWNVDGINDYRDVGTGAGHGTHVCGVALGNTSAAITSDYSGGAPQARLVMCDVLPMNGGDFLQIPLDIGSTLLNFSTSCNSHVHEMSWGGDANGQYTGDEQSIDLYCWKHRQMVVVIAAGNSGPSKRTISSPAMAKNAITVGASMNSPEAYELGGGVITGSRNFYTHDRVATFSSVGSADLAFRKPDVLAPGDPIWSANANQPANTPCTQTAKVIIGMRGTSMAVPDAASACIMLREYFVDKHYPNSANVNTAGDTSTPTSSLIRAMLVSSAVPMAAQFPNIPFTSTQDRIDRSGFGGIRLERVVEVPATTSTSQTVVLSNERAGLALTAQRSVLWCIRLSATSQPGDQIIVTLAYTDYPSTPFAQASLVNDLRLDVWTSIDATTQPTQQYVNDLTNGAPELRSTTERVVISNPTAMVSIRVHADTIGFGQQQEFSLVFIIVRASTSSANRVVVQTISTPVAVPSSDPLACVLCKSTVTAPLATFQPNNLCTQCGDGIVQSQDEECDGTECCDPATCTVLNDKSPCSITVGECRVHGVCRGKGLLCAIDQSLHYVNTADDGTKCQVAPAPVPSPPNAPNQPPSPSPTQPSGCQTKSSSEWSTELALDNTIAGTKTLCCAPLWAVYDMIAFEPLFARLAQEYAAAYLNSIQDGAVLSALQLVQIEAARELLEAHCTTGFIRNAERDAGEKLLLALQFFNKPCHSQNGVVVNNNDATSCLAQTDLSSLLCSGDGGIYDDSLNQCLCNADRQQGEPDCMHLACSGHGASILDYKLNTQSCVCLPGWNGTACDECAVVNSSPLNPPYVYHCIGVPQSLLGSVAQKRFLTVVGKSSVSARLSGQFYRFANKIADGVPGVRGLDCWCRTSDEVATLPQSTTHNEAYKAATEQYATMLLIGARAEFLLQNLWLGLSSGANNAAAVGLPALPNGHESDNQNSNNNFGGNPFQPIDVSSDGTKTQCITIDVIVIAVVLLWSAFSRK